MVIGMKSPFPNLARDAAPAPPLTNQKEIVAPAANEDWHGDDVPRAERSAV
jgi:hypothetical protein